MMTPQLWGLTHSVPPASLPVGRFQMCAPNPARLFLPRPLWVGLYFSHSPKGTWVILPSRSSFRCQGSEAGSEVRSWAQSLEVKEMWVQILMRIRISESNLWQTNLPTPWFFMYKKIHGKIKRTWEDVPKDLSTLPGTEEESNGTGQTIN